MLPFLRSYLSANKKYWSIFEPRQEASFYTVSVQREKIRESLFQMRDRREYNFGIFESDTSQLDWSYFTL